METGGPRPQLGLYFRKDLQRVLQSGHDHVTQRRVETLGGSETQELAGGRGEGGLGIAEGWAVNRHLRHLQRLALIRRTRQPRPAGFYFREVGACPAPRVPCLEARGCRRPMRRREERCQGGRPCSPLCGYGLEVAVCLERVGLGCLSEEEGRGGE